MTIGSLQHFHPRSSGGRRSDPRRAATKVAELSRRARLCFGMARFLLVAVAVSAVVFVALVAMLAG